MSDWIGTGSPITGTGAPGYSLANIATALRRLMPWSTISVSGEPLTGLVNGSNTAFFVARPPVSGSVVVVSSGGVAQTVSSLDVDSGRVVLSVAPSAPCFATYTHSAFSDAALLGYAQEGFRYMETLLPRGYYLTSSSGATYVSSSATAVVDPVVGSTTFSASVSQTRFLDMCSWLMFLIGQQTETAINAIMVREERMGGLMIDRTKQPQAWTALIEQAQQRLAESAASAADEAGLLNTLIEGGIDQGARSDYYEHNLDWWQYSKQYYEG